VTTPGTDLAYDRVHPSSRAPRQCAVMVKRDRLTRAADIIRGALLCAAAAFLATGDGSAGLKALLVLAPALAARFARVPPAFDLVFTLALAAEAIGTKLGAYDAINSEDTLSHTALPFLSGPVVYGVLARLGVVTEPGDAREARPLLRAATVTAVGILALGVAWELVEWAADSALRTDYSRGYSDTRADLINDAIAAVASGVLVAAWLRICARRPGS
jgi:hypothetical protein